MKQSTRTLLNEAASKFRFYEDEHRNKAENFRKEDASLTENFKHIRANASEEKAQVNANWAGRIEQHLADNNGRAMYEDSKFVSQLCQDVFNDNVRAGWWTNLDTGESTVKTRNRAELLMLTVSELSEGSEGYAEDLNDDKLPEFKMLDVELADAAIRLCDQLGSLGPDEYGTIIGGCDQRGLALAHNMRQRSVDGALMLVVNELSRAMEHVRKNRHTQYRHALCDALMAIFRFAEQQDINLLEVIEDKRAFNRQREDHKPENRKERFGKKF